MTQQTRPGRKGDDNRDAPVALYLHCTQTYEKMFEHATKKHDDTGEEIIVYEGMLTRLITQELYLPTPYYSLITQALKRMRCIRQLRRGGGSAPSQWELIQHPTEELFNNSRPIKVPGKNKQDMVQDQISALNTRVLKLETVLEKVIEDD